MNGVFSKNLLAFAMVLAAISPASCTDLKVVAVFRFRDGDTYTQTRYYQGERARSEWQEHTQWKPGLVTYGPPRATIVECDVQRAIDMDLKAHQYSVTELNDECVSKTAPAPPPTKGTVDVYIESTDTGERQQILGQTARHIITHKRQVASAQACWGNNETEVDGWYVDGHDLARKPRQDESAANVVRTGANCRDKIVLHRTGLDKLGSPVKLLQISRSSHLKADGTSNESIIRWEMEVTELSQAPLDPALFELPAGFTKVARIDGQPEMPVSVAIEYWWQRALNTVRSWF